MFTTLEYALYLARKEGRDKFRLVLRCGLIVVYRKTPRLGVPTGFVTAIPVVQLRQEDDGVRTYFREWLKEDW